MEFRRVKLDDLKRLHDEGHLVGVFECSNEDYHNAPGISSTLLSNFEVSPKTYKHLLLNPEPPTEALHAGQVLHKMVLEKEKFFETYAVADADITRRDARTKAWQEVVAKNPGKEILKFTEYEAARVMAEIAHEHSRAALLTGYRELSFFWKDPKTGLQCKCRADVITKKGVIVDYKTSDLVYPKRVWSKQIGTYRYDRQGAFYLDGVTYALEQSKEELPECEAVKAFVHYAQEKSAPYLVKPWHLGDASIVLGRRSYEELLVKIKECEEKKEWPGYPETVETCEAPDYLWDKELENVNE